MRDEILTICAMLALAGSLVYGFKQKAANTAAAQASGQTIGGDPASAFNIGPAIYVGPTPYLFQQALGNVIPPSSAATTLPGTQPAQSTCSGCEG